MKFKTIFIKGLALALVVSAISGCAPKTSETPKTGETPKEATATSAEPEKKGNPVELKIHFHSNNKYTLADKSGKLLPVFALAEEKTNTKIIDMANPNATKSEQEFQLQATEQFPSDIYGGTNVKNGIYTYAKDGAFVPLNELIDKYAPNVKAYLESHAEVRKSITAPDGNIYMLPYVPDGGVARTYFIRTDWLKKINKPVPKTIQELEEVLYAFRDTDLNGNGKKDEIPFFNDKFEEAIRAINLFGARVYGFDSYRERVVLDENDKFYQAWIHDDFKKGLTKLAQWYKDGIIDQELFTRQANTARDTLLTKENRGGMTHEWVASTSSFNYKKELLDVVPDFKFEGFLPVTQEDGKPGFEEHQRIVSKPDGWGISASSKNQEAAIKLMDWFYTEEGNNAINFGIEGQSYTMVDGKPKFTDEVLKQGAVNKYIIETYGAQSTIGYAQNYEYEKQWTNEIGQEAYDLYTNSDAYSVKMTPVMTYTDEELEVLEKDLTALLTYQDEQILLFITGKLDIEKGWDAYVAKCKELGAEKIVAAYESAYARYKAN